MKKNWVLIFIGITLGSVITALYLGNKHAAELEEEEFEYTKESENPEPKSDPIERDQKEKVLVMNNNRYRKIVKPYGQVEEAMDKPELVLTAAYPSPPYLINEELYQCGDNEKVIVYYYTDDEILSTDDDMVIEDIENTIGYDAVSYFEDDKTDGEYDECQVVHVRNNRLGIDYEVIRRDKNYAETMATDEEE